MNRQLRNTAASVRTRLKGSLTGNRETFQFLLERYALERLLYRIGESPHRGRFILKGAMLFSLWQENPYRPTRDVDFLGFGEKDEIHLAEIFREICRMPVVDDGLIFSPESVEASRIREDLPYGGVRIRLVAYLENARLNIQADIGFGDVVTPEAQWVDFPTLLDHPAPRLRAYPQESVISEKLHAMVVRGTTNTRMKDFCDMWTLARNFTFEGNALAQAIRATFDCRRTTIPGDVPAALTSRFLEEKDGGAWKAFFQKGNMSEPYRPFPEVGELLRSFILPVAQSLANGENFSLIWSPGGPWRKVESCQEPPRLG